MTVAGMNMKIKFSHEVLFERNKNQQRLEIKVPRTIPQLQDS